MSCLSLRLGEDQQSVEAIFNAFAEKEEVSELWVKKQLAASDFRCFKLLDSGLAALLAEMNDSSLSPQQPPCVHIIAKRVDALLSLVISPDQMSASATIIAAYAGQSIQQPALQQALQAQGVTAGIDAAAISMLLEQARAGEPGVPFTQTVATAKAAVNGKNGCWVADVQTLRERLTPQTRQDGTVDLRDLGEILTVKEGRQLMHRQPPTPGQNGFSLSGEPLAAVAGKAAEFIAADGVRLSADGDLITASRSGMPVNIPGGMRVDNVYQIKNVDLSSGDITFDGSVIIQNDVEAGMKVAATGDVTVGGAVYFATITAGGDIVVRKGGVGNQRQDDNNHFDSSDLSCSLIAKGHLSLGFAQYARLKAGAGIEVAKQLLHCLTHTRGDIDIGKGSDLNSKLIGGVTRAGNRIRCGSYGNEAFVPTDVELCPDIQALHDQLSICAEQIGCKQQLIDDLKQILPKVSALPEGVLRQEKLTKVVNTISHSAEEVVALQQKVAALKKLESARLEAAGVIALKTIFPNVSVAIAGQKLKTSREYQGGGLCYRQPEIIHDPALK